MDHSFHLKRDSSLRSTLLDSSSKSLAIHSVTRSRLTTTCLRLVLPLSLVATEELATEEPDRLVGTVYENWCIQFDLWRLLLDLAKSSLRMVTLTAETFSKESFIGEAHLPCGLPPSQVCHWNFSISNQRNLKRFSIGASLFSFWFSEFLICFFWF